jgi:hypothetical protein
MGLDEVMHETTNMAIHLAGVAKPIARVENAKVNIPKPNLKTWKRMARRPLENGLPNRILTEGRGRLGAQWRMRYYRL